VIEAACRVATSAAGACLVLAGCSGVQSALDPAGMEADAVARLFWVMVAAGTLIWLAVIGALIYATRSRRRIHDERTARLVIIWGGGVVPALLLALLLGYALWLMPNIRPWVESDPADGLRIEVVGEQFWWRVTYVDGGRAPVVAANEVRLPVGERVQFVLTSPDVIHSFWIPPLAGKMDMIPGRTNRLSLLATEAGAWRGTCAEFCGTSHALMAFTVVAMEPAAFRAWLAERAAPAANAGGQGHAAFMAHGCAACHSILGTEAAGTVGPDLSHVGSRERLGAGILPMNVDSIARFIREPDVIKPGARMPAFHMLPESDVAAIAAYLAGLR
jgi:cytochrome c oxidase subunit 2